MTLFPGLISKNNLYPGYKPGLGLITKTIQGKVVAPTITAFTLAGSSTTALTPTFTITGTYTFAYLHDDNTGTSYSPVTSGVPVTTGAIYSDFTLIVVWGGTPVISDPVTAATLPTAPSALVITAVSTTSVSVAFTAGSSLTPSISYVLSTGETGSSSPIARTGLTANTQYTNTAYAVDSLGQHSANSGSASGYTLAAAPTAVSSVGTASDAITTSWTDPAGSIVTYDGQWSDDNFATHTEVTGVSKPWVLSGISPFRKIYTKILANGGGGGTYSSSVNTYPLVTANLWSYLKFDDGSGSNCADSSGNSRVGTTHASPTWSASVPSQIQFTDPFCLAFNGSTQYVSLASAQGPQTGFSLSCWVNLTDTAATYVVSSWYTQGSNAYYQFFTTSGGGITARMHQVVDVIYIGRTAPAASIGTGWHHLCFTWSGGTTAAAIKIFVDGVQVDTANDNLGSFTAINSGSSIPLIAGQNSVSPPAAPFKGSIDDVRFSTAPFTANQITALAGGYA